MGEQFPRRQYRNIMRDLQYSMTYRSESYFISRSGHGDVRLWLQHSLVLKILIKQTVVLSLTDISRLLGRQKPFNLSS